MSAEEDRGVEFAKRFTALLDEFKISPAELLIIANNMQARAILAVIATAPKPKTD